MILAGLVPKFDQLLERTLRTLLVTLTVFSALAAVILMVSAMGRWLNPAAPVYDSTIAFVWPIFLVELLSILLLAIAYRSFHAGRRRAAAWMLILVNCFGGLMIILLHPYAAAFPFIFAVYAILIVMPHLTLREMRIAGLMGLGGLMLTTIWMTLRGEVIGGVSVTLVLRAAFLLFAALASLLLFGILYQVSINGLLEIKSANTALVESDTRLREEIAVRSSAEAHARSQNAYLAALHETSKNLMHRMDRTVLVEHIVRRVCELTGTEDAVVHLLSDDGNTLEAALALGIFVQMRRDEPHPVYRGQGLVGRVWQSGRMQTVADYSSWQYRVSWGAPNLHELTAVPLLVGDKVVGTIALGFTDPDRHLSIDELDALQRFAQLASIALDNSQLYEQSKANEAVLQQRVAERTNELDRMLSIANNLSSTFDIAELPVRIFDELKHVIDYDSGSFMVEHGDGQLRMIYYRGPNLPQVGKDTLWPLCNHHAIVFNSQKPLLIPDTTADTPDAIEFRRMTIDHFKVNVPQNIVTWLGVPMIAYGRVMGLLTLDSIHPNAFTERDMALAMAVAQQAALAFENTRLYAKSVQAAATAERSRLARDLHDSVSQAVFSMALGARTMQQLAEVAPERVLEPLPHVVSLAEAALTEMRALLFELRPESLEEEGLFGAFDKHLAALRTRHGLQAVADFDPHEPDVDLAVKEALYRIGLEAMHNAVKHARARNVTLSVHRANSGIVMTVKDDGIGFDVAAVPNGHYGLKTMRERVAQFGGNIAINSIPGSGTSVSVFVPDSPMQSPTGAVAQVEGPDALHYVV